jgi:hypothetical protein
MSEAAEIDSCDKAGAGGGDPEALKAIIAVLREQNTAQQALIAQLQERIAERPSMSASKRNAILAA